MAAPWRTCYHCEEARKQTQCLPRMEMVTPKRNHLHLQLFRSEGCLCCGSQGRKQRCEVDDSWQVNTASPKGWSHCKLEYLQGGQGQPPQVTRRPRRNPLRGVDLHCTACTGHLFSIEDSKLLYSGMTYLSMPYTMSTSSSTTSELTSAKITCLSLRGSRPRPPKMGNFKASSKLWTG